MAIINSEQVGKFNSQLSEKKAADPLLSGASPEALDIAIGQARREVIPGSFGAAMFSIPEGKDPDQYINSITDNIVSTAVGNFKDLSIQNPTYLSGWIQNRPSFKDSKAYNDLKTITKTEFDTIENGISDLESGESADFRNKDLNKISSYNLQHVLDSTVLNYLKEIGIQRATGAAPSDEYVSKSAQDVFDFLAKALTPPTPKPEESLPPVTNPEQPLPAPSPVTVGKEQEQTPSAGIPATVTTAQQEITNPVVAPPEPTVATEPLAESTPTVVQQSQTNVTNITNQGISGTEPRTLGAATTREFSREESPLLSLLGEQLGMGAGEIANMFAGADEATFDQAVNQSFGGMETVTQQVGDIIQNNPGIVAQASTAVQGMVKSEAPTEKVSERVANVISKTTGITEQAPAPTIEQTTPAPQPTPPSPSPSASQEEKEQKSPESKVQEEKEKSAAEAETKAADDAKKDEEQRTNGELLRTMKEILKVLQGPLIVTDNSHKFS